MLFLEMPETSNSCHQCSSILCYSLVYILSLLYVGRPVVIQVDYFPWFGCICVIFTYGQHAFDIKPCIYFIFFYSLRSGFCTMYMQGLVLEFSVQKIWLNVCCKIWQYIQFFIWQCSYNHLSYFVPDIFVHMLFQDTHLT